MRTLMITLVASSLLGCGDDSTKGSVDAVPDRDGLDAVSDTRDATETPDDTSVAEATVDETTATDTTPDDTTATDTSAEDTSAEDTSPEVIEEVVVPVCGDGLIEGTEPCDDGDECAGDGCDACQAEPALAVVTLELDQDIGWDLDDADGDGDPETGVDNLLGASSVMRIAVSTVIGQPIARGDILLLGILGDVESLNNDPDVRLALVTGRSDCPAQSPPAWLERGDPPASVRRDPAAFEACVAATTIDDDDDPANGILQGPSRIRFWGDTIDLTLGGVGSVRIARGRVEGELARSGDRLRGLDDGRIGGVIPASALAAIDTSGFTPLCPTALHAALGLAGHIDQDAEGDGGKDFILWTTSQGLPCVSAPVTIVGCCDEGDCEGGRIDGAGCVGDPRIGDGFSAGFRVIANGVRVAGAGTGVCAP